jgi:hypothetical protein
MITVATIVDFAVSISPFSFLRRITKGTLPGISMTAKIVKNTVKTFSTNSMKI